MEGWTLIHPFCDVRKFLLLNLSSSFEVNAVCDCVFYGTTKLTAFTLFLLNVTLNIEIVQQTLLCEKNWKARLGFRLQPSLADRITSSKSGKTVV